MYHSIDIMTSLMDDQAVSVPGLLTIVIDMSIPLLLSSFDGKRFKAFDNNHHHQDIVTSNVNKSRETSSFRNL